MKRNTLVKLILTDRTAAALMLLKTAKMDDSFVFGKICWICYCHITGTG